MSRPTTDFSATPYYDDYNVDKKFYKILFVPQRAVQTREINQLQEIGQEQIRRFGDHVFKDGSIVHGCNISQIPTLNYVRLTNAYDATAANTAFGSSLENFLVVSEVTDVRASVRLVKQGYTAQYPNTNTLYIDYIKTGRDGSNNEVKVFTSGETIQLYTTDQDKFANTLSSGYLYNTIAVHTANVVAGEMSVGNTVGISVNDGIIYQKGYFVKVSAHTITVKDYDSNTSGMFVGFDTQESIVTHLQDLSLIDPSDTSQRNAIGADRFKLTPTLIAIHKDDISDTNDFFPIVEYSNSTPISQKNDPEYAALGDWVGKRNWESDGDWYKKPFIIGSEHTSNNEVYNYVINAGIAYVKGNRVELISATTVDALRATTTDEENASTITLNYGNYVIVDEVVGVFDYDQLDTIDIYDTPQNSISDIEGAGSAPSGNTVGTANIRGYIFDNGTKGKYDAQYRLYIANIQMDSGKSFSTDAKSFFANSSTYGPVKADIVLESSKAVIKDTSHSTLIFDTGLKGTKRLRSSVGVNDTQFYYRDLSQATLQANGSVTFTLNSPHAGGTERFFSSVGTLSNINELKVDIILTDAAYSNTLSGSVDSDTTSNVMTGVSTTFTDDFNVGEFVRVTANTTNHFIRQVVSITNNTVMQLNADIVGANGTAEYRKYFMAGSVLDLTDATVTADSNTQFTVALGYDLEGGAPQTITASYPVFRSEAVETKKSVKKDVFVKIDCSVGGGVQGPWDLGLTDVYKIQNVYLGTTYSETNPDRISWFNLDTGQSDIHYDHSKLTIKPAFSSNLTTSSKLLVKLSHFQANTATGIGFFSVDSYPTRSPSDTANSTNISYADIPIYNGYNLRNCIDFRPQKINTANSATDANNATVNPVASNTSYIVPASGTYIGEPDSNFTADIEYYLPRVDLIQVSKDGVFNVKSSIPSISPLTPVASEDAMPLASAYVPPFPSLTSTEKGSYGKNKEYIKINLEGNRGYTKKDINVLDKRISRLEYYQTLSALETQARDFTVKDENGLDRFKNGIFADPFKNHLLGDISNFEYSIAIDEQKSIARPKFDKKNVDLKIGANTGTTSNGHVASLAYSSLSYIQQPYASKFRTIADSIWKWNGTVSLFPEYDHFRDEQLEPDVNVVVDIASPWEDFASSPFGQNFGDWRVANRQTNSNSTVNNSGQTTTTTTTTSTTLSRELQKINIDSSQTTYDLGSFISEFTLNPYMRSRDVAFIVTGLKPNTIFYPYFDKVPVSAYCAPGALTSAYNADTGTLSVTEGNESQVISRTSAWGTELLSDENGNLYGVFNIPDNTFKVGDREFRICDVDSLTTGSDAVTSSAIAIYVASSLAISSKNINITTIDPKFSVDTTREVDVQTSTNVTSTTNWFNTNSNGEPPSAEEIANNEFDPLGQTFFVDTPKNVPGIFADSIGVYFKSKDAKLGISCLICEMIAGVPDASKIIGRSYLKPSEVQVSTDATLETVFTFNDLPYLTKEKYYAFFLMPDGNSPEYTLWVSEVGGEDVTTGYKIFSNPYIGNGVKSSNANGWTILQTEDIKFNLYRCNFSPTSGTLDLYDQDDDYFTVDGFTYANVDFSVQIGDVVYSQNSTGGLLLGNTDPFGTIQYIDQSKDILVIDGSTGGFTANTVLEIHRPDQTNNVSAINANTKIAESTIVSVDDVEYSIIVPRIGTITPFGTDISVSYKGIDSSETEDSNWYNLELETELELVDKMRVIKSTSNRSSVTESAKLRLNLTTNNSYVSPIVDLRRRGAFFIKNVVNNDTDNEETRYGNALTKYISRKVILAEGQDAEDIKIFVTGYRPYQTNIHCYVKLLNNEDTEAFEDKLWTEMVMVEGSTVTSSSSDTEDYKEFGFSFPTIEGIQGQAYLNSDNNSIVEYRNSTGAVFVGYKTFAIKLVLTAENEETVPRMQDIRAIALQV